MSARRHVGQIRSASGPANPNLLWFLPPAHDLDCAVLRPITGAGVDLARRTHAVVILEADDSTYSLKIANGAFQAHP